MSLLINILLGVYIFVSVLMMLIILMQRPKSEGLGAAFGGGVTENIFGAQTTNVLTKITGWLAAIFFLLTFLLSILYARKANRPSNLSRELMLGTTPIPAASATASPGPSSAVGPPGTVTNMTPATTGPASSVRPSDAAVGAVPPAANTSPAAASPAPSAAVSVAPATTPAPSPNASAAASASVSPKP